MNFDANAYLTKVREKIRQDYGEVCKDGGASLDNLRKVVERFIDENDIEFHVDGGKLRNIFHPVWGGKSWMLDRKLSEWTTVETSLGNPEEMEKIQAALKAGMKEEVLAATRPDLLDRLNSPYMFYALKETKEFMTTEDFSAAMSEAARPYNNELRAEGDLSKDDLLELLKACDPKVFSDADLFQGHSGTDEVSVYLDEVDSPTLVFSWCSSAEKLVNRTISIEGVESLKGRGAYKAKIKVQDILGCFDTKDEYDIILNPDKLYDVEYFGELSALCSIIALEKFCSKEELEEIMDIFGWDDDEGEDDDE